MSCISWSRARRKARKANTEKASLQPLLGVDEEDERLLGEEGLGETEESLVAKPGLYERKLGGFSVIGSCLIIGGIIPCSLPAACCCMWKGMKGL